MTPRQEKLWDYFILSARVLLALTFLSYGWGKVSNGQFGISEKELATPVKDLSLFRLSWYLFDKEPFKSFVGVSQIVAALLLLYNRTLIIGALMSIPILANILIVDITYVKMPPFYWRLSYYLFLDFLILWHYKERMVSAFKTVFTGLSTKFSYPWWAYVLLPVMAIGMEVLGTIPKLIKDLIFDPAITINALIHIPGYIIELIKKGFG